MALPVIDSITIVPPEIHECESAVITINAHDPSPSPPTPPRDVTLELRVGNNQGEVVPSTVTVRIAGSGGSGPLMYRLTVPEGQGEVIQDPNMPNVFTYHAPCPDDPNHNHITHVTNPTGPPHTH